MKHTSTEVTHEVLALAIEGYGVSFSARRAAAVLRRRGMDVTLGQVRGAVMRLIESGRLDRTHRRGRFGWVPPAQRRKHKAASERLVEERRWVARCLVLLRIANVVEPFKADDEHDSDERAHATRITLSADEARKLAALLTMLSAGAP
jgi:hypothetical protein